MVYVLDCCFYHKNISQELLYLLVMYLLVMYFAYVILQEHFTLLLCTCSFTGTFWPTVVYV